MHAVYRLKLKTATRHTSFAQPKGLATISDCGLRIHPLWAVTIADCGLIRSGR